MKIQRIGILLLVLCVIGISIISSTLVRYEKRKRTRDIRNKGNYLVTLIGLHSIKDFEGDKRAFFLRTLHEYISCEGLVYCLIHDHNGEPFVMLDPYNLVSSIPRDVQIRSIYTAGLQHQTFQTGDSDQTIYDFAKPLFENGQLAGTVRLGLRLAPISLFSMERIGLLATIAFFLFAMVPFIYYGIKLALQPLKSLSLKIESMVGGSVPVVADMAKNPPVDDMINRFDQSLTVLREKHTRLEAVNIELEARQGVIAYEKKQMTNILDSVHYGVIITDTQDTVNHTNAYMVNLLDKNRDEMIDRPLSEVLEHEEILSFISEQKVAGQRTNQRHIETTFPAQAPEELFEVTLSYLSDGEGTIIGKVVSVRNITTQKSAERAKHEFVAHVAHELRAPLTTIKSYNEMLMDGEIDELETQKEFYNTINEETDRLARLIQNLLNISKIEMGSLTLDGGLVKTDWLVTDCIAAVEAPAQKKHITIEKNLPDQWPSLVGDKELLKVAIINILGNAVKYSPENRTITFSLKEEDHTVIFDVIDQGYGISEEDLPHVFDKFYRSADSHIAEQTGSGLGLAMTSEIIRLHGGEVEVKSTPGEGTHFSIKLPRGEYQLGKQ